MKIFTSKLLFSCITMNKILSTFIFLIVLVSLVYLAGPAPKKLEVDPSVQALMDPTNFNPNYVAEAVEQHEANLDIKPGNESQLYWADSASKKTPFVLLYLHGFSACPEEGQPIYLNFAKRYKMNAYAPLLAEHGLVEDEPMLHFTAEKYLESAKQALRLAHLMGDSVIVMSTSTGSTAALFLASGQNNIHSLICYSPNVAIYDPKSKLLAGPWGLEIARKVKASNYHTWEAPGEAAQYWHLKYRLESLVELQRLVEATMTEATFQRVKVPTFIAYYYKNEVEQDHVVSVPRLLEMYQQLGSPIKKKVALPNISKHALASQYFSKDLGSVSRETFLFADDLLRLSPAQ